MNKVYDFVLSCIGSWELFFFVIGCLFLIGYIVSYYFIKKNPKVLEQSEGEQKHE